MSSGSLYALGTIFGGDPDQPNALQRAGMTLHPEIANQRMQGQLIQAQYLQALMDMQKQEKVQSALKDMGKLSPAELSKNLAMIDPKNYLTEYLDTNKEAVSTSPTGTPVNVPPSDKPKPLYQNGKPFVTGADDGFMWAENPDGQRVQIPKPGGTQERAKDKFLGKIDQVGVALIGRPLTQKELETGVLETEATGGIKDFGGPMEGYKDPSTGEAGWTRAASRLVNPKGEKARQLLEQALSDAELTVAQMELKGQGQVTEAERAIARGKLPSTSDIDVGTSIQKLSNLYRQTKGLPAIAPGGGVSGALTREQWLKSRPGAKQ